MLVKANSIRLSLLMLDPAMAHTQRAVVSLICLSHLEGNFLNLAAQILVFKLLLHIFDLFGLISSHNLRHVLETLVSLGDPLFEVFARASLEGSEMQPRHDGLENTFSAVENCHQIGLNMVQAQS